MVYNRKRPRQKSDAWEKKKKHKDSEKTDFEEDDGGPVEFCVRTTKVVLKNMVEPNFPNHFTGLTDTLYNEPEWVESYRTMLKGWTKDNQMMVLSPEWKFTLVTGALILSVYQTNRAKAPKGVPTGSSNPPPQPKYTSYTQPKGPPTEAPPGKISEIETKEFPYY